MSTMRHSLGKKIKAWASNSLLAPIYPRNRIGTPRKAKLGDVATIYSVETAKRGSSGSWNSLTSLFSGEIVLLSPVSSSHGYGNKVAVNIENVKGVMIVKRGYDSRRYDKMCLGQVSVWNFLKWRNSYRQLSWMWRYDNLLLEYLNGQLSNRAKLEIVLTAGLDCASVDRLG